MKLIILGDSTLQYNDETTFPQVGWPQMVYDKFKKDVEIINLAKNGRSTKSFIDEKRFDEALTYMDKDSVVIIEFGHNDSHDYDLSQYTRADVEYYDNLVYMVNESKKKGAYVLLSTPVYRRWFNEDGTMKPCHTGYKEAMEKVAKDTNTDLVNLCDLTKDYLLSIGIDKSRDLYMNFDKDIYPNYPEGLDDNTHLRPEGGKAYGSLFINEAKKYKKFEELLNV